MTAFKRPKPVHQMTAGNSRKPFPTKTIDRTKREYVLGAVHTNTIEGFWSIIKRGVAGSFHEVSKKYMLLDVAESQFRYNNRFNADIFGTAIAAC